MDSPASIPGALFALAAPPAEFVPGRQPESSQQQPRGEKVEHIEISGILSIPSIKTSSPTFTNLHLGHHPDGRAFGIPSIKPAGNTRDQPLN